MSKPKITKVTMKDAKGRVVYKRTGNSVTMRGAMAKNYIDALNAELKKNNGKDN